MLTAVPHAARHRGDPARASLVWFYSAGCSARWVRSWHAWRTGTPVLLAAARMQPVTAYGAYCQKSSVCHQATSSSRSGSVLATALSLAAANHGHGQFVDLEIRMTEPPEPDPEAFAEHTRLSGQGPTSIFIPTS